MGCFVNGAFLTQQAGTPEISEADVQAFLASRKNVNCDRLHAVISKETCARNHLCAVKFSSASNIEVNSAYRKPCLDCKTGIKNAKGLHVDTRTCKVCGRDLTSVTEARNRTGVCYSCRGIKSKKAGGKKRSALNKVVNA